MENHNYNLNDVKHIQMSLMWRSRSKFHSLHDHTHIEANNSKSTANDEVKSDEKAKFEKGADKMRRTGFDDTCALLNFAWYNEGSFVKEVSFKMVTDLFASQISLVQPKTSLTWAGPYFEFKDNMVLQHLIQKELKPRMRSESAKLILQNLQ